MSGSNSKRNQGSGKRERQQRAKEQKRKERAVRRVRRVVLIVAGIVVVLGVLGVVGYSLLNRPGEHVQSMGRDHIPAGTSRSVSYSTNPPTSGPHYAGSADPGIYDEPVDDGYLVHSLEHGYVVISYACGEMPEGQCEELSGRLADLARRQRLWKLIVIPRPGMETPIALTAWQRIDRLEEFDRRRIVSFIETWRDNGPEDTAS